MLVAVVSGVGRESAVGRGAAGVGRVQAADRIIRTRTSGMRWIGFLEQHFRICTSMLFILHHSSENSNQNVLLLWPVCIVAYSCV